MREYRGKRVDTGEWIYGCPLETKMSGVYIIGTSTKSRKRRAGGVAVGDEVWQYEVDPKTVGQHTGYKDIYKGDICTDGRTTVEIVWDRYQWGCKVIKGSILSEGLVFPLWHWDNCEMNGYRELEKIGNIHDNPWRGDEGE